MAEFESKIFALAVEPHPNADLIELAVVGGYRAVVRKGEFANGDLAAYIPEGAICPEWLITELGLEGRLAGSKKNRVKAVRLRGVLSQGLVYPATGSRLRGRALSVGDDVTALLELVKYEPPVPTTMSGMLKNASGKTLRYEIENVKKHPDVLQPGEPVAITEKLHGTWCCLGRRAGDPDDPWIVSSKGLAASGLAFKLGEDENLRNLYVRAWRRYRDAVQAINEAAVAAGLAAAGEPFYLLGEIYGRGVQDLHYGLKAPELALFDAYIGEPGRGRWLNPSELSAVAAEHMPVVPAIFEGPYSIDVLEAATEGETTVPAGRHMREGCVIRPLVEREDMTLGRVVLKSVSDDYLTRKGGTEYT